jgi:hypothetical protein
VLDLAYDWLREAADQKNRDERFHDFGDMRACSRNPGLDPFHKHEILTFIGLTICDYSDCFSCAGKHGELQIQQADSAFPVS